MLTRWNVNGDIFQDHVLRQVFPHLRLSRASIRIEAKHILGDDAGDVSLQDALQRVVDDTTGVAALEAFCRVTSHLQKHPEAVEARLWFPPSTSAQVKAIARQIVRLAAAVEVDGGLNTELQAMDAIILPGLGEEPVFTHIEASGQWLCDAHIDDVIALRDVSARSRSVDVHQVTESMAALSVGTPTNASAALPVPAPEAQPSLSGPDDEAKAGYRNVASPAGAQPMREDTGIYRGTQLEESDMAEEKEQLDDGDVPFFENVCDLFRTCMRDIEELLDAINNSSFARYLVLGQTRSGKATFVRVAKGDEFTREMVQFRQIIKFSSQRVLNIYRSETLIPSMYTIPTDAQDAFLRTPVANSEVRLIDTPGFEDNRSVEYKIATSLIMHHLLKHTQFWHGVLITINKGWFIEDGLHSLRATARNIKAFLPLSALKGSACFLITNCDQVRDVDMGRFVEVIAGPRGTINALKKTDDSDDLVELLELIVAKYVAVDYDNSLTLPTLNPIVHSTFQYKPPPNQLNIISVELQKYLGRITVALLAVNGHRDSVRHLKARICALHGEIDRTNAMLKQDRKGRIKALNDTKAIARKEIDHCHELIAIEDRIIASCRKEIEQAEGLIEDTYAEDPHYETFTEESEPKNMTQRATVRVRTDKITKVVKIEPSGIHAEKLEEDYDNGNFTVKLKRNRLQGSFVAAVKVMILHKDRSMVQRDRARQETRITVKEQSIRQIERIQEQERVRIALQEDVIAEQSKLVELAEIDHDQETKELEALVVKLTKSVQEAYMEVQAEEKNIAENVPSINEYIASVNLIFSLSISKEVQISVKEEITSIKYHLKSLQKDGVKISVLRHVVVD